MFTIPEANIIDSDEGWSIKVLGRTGIEYYENGRKLYVASEVLAGPSGMVVYRDSIKTWNSPNDTEDVSDVKRDTIIENIRRAFRFQGLEIEIA